MKRTERLQCNVTEKEQREFRKIAMERGYSHGSELVRELIYDFLEARDVETSRSEDAEGNPSRAAAE